MPVGAQAFCSSRLGMALGWQHGRLLEPHGGAARSSTPLLRVPTCHDGWTGPPYLSPVASLPVGVVTAGHPAPTLGESVPPSQTGTRGFASGAIGSSESETATGSREGNMSY